jgi:hypothetical protein
LPSVLPAAFWQSPEQQLLLSLHTSPVWMQKDAPSLHTPASHSCEQHCALVLHGLPAVLQVVLSGWQTPPLQLPPQHAAESVQACPSATHAVALQRPAVQWSEQHSVAVAQPPPVGAQTLMEVAQVKLAGSQIPEQHWALPVQSCVVARQKGDGTTSRTAASPRLTTGPSSPPAPPAVASRELPRGSVLLQAASATSPRASMDEGRSELCMLSP